MRTGRNNTDRRVRIETSRTHEAVAIDVPVMEAGGAYELHHVGGGVGGKVRVLPHGSRLDVSSCALFLAVPYAWCTHH